MVEMWSPEKEQIVEDARQKWLAYVEENGFKPTDQIGVDHLLNTVKRGGSDRGRMTDLIGMAYDRVVPMADSPERAGELVLNGLKQQTETLLSKNNKQGAVAAQRVARHAFDNLPGPKPVPVPIPRPIPGPEPKPVPEPEPVPDKPEPVPGYNSLTKKGRRLFHEIVHHLLNGRCVQLSGPAGTGKTYIAQLAATYVNWLKTGKFIEPGIITAPQEAYEIQGFVDAKGTRVDTPLTYALINGLVFLVDELDRSMPPALIAMNAPLANGVMTLPGEGTPTAAAPGFACIATANTFGRGATEEYGTANQLDSSTLDRFVVIYVDYDLELVEKMARGHLGLKTFFVLWHDAVKEKKLTTAVFSYRSVRTIAATLDTKVEDLQEEFADFPLTKRELESLRKHLVDECVWTQLVKGLPATHLSQILEYIKNSTEFRRLIALHEGDAEYQVGLELKELVTLLKNSQRRMEEVA